MQLYLVSWFNFAIGRKVGNHWRQNVSLSCLFVRDLPRRTGTKKDVGVLLFAHPVIRPSLPTQRISNVASPRQG